MTLKNDLEVKNLCELCGNAINCPMLAGVIREECGLYKPIDKNDLVCIDKWDIDGKKAEAWIVKGKLQIRNRGTCHNIELPSVTPQELRWIPVSERLPEDSGEYLVSLADEDSTSDYEAVGIAWFAHPKDYDLGCEKDGEWRELAFGEVVIAWMPLPQPYSEVEE